MKYIFIVLFGLAAYQSNAQKYILLDKTMSQPAFYSNTISVSEKFNGFFPVGKQEIGRFIEALEEILKRLSSDKITGKAKQYQIGCIRFSGVVIGLSSGDRLDYVLTSTCENVRITMHLSDAKLNNENNAYFINAWIKYIKNALKEK
ncbi:MAG TPA: hypothetical protein VFI29_18520 [Hanamia sp.]|nr:hypothetical protein [Hanamia sp.]